MTNENLIKEESKQENIDLLGVRIFTIELWCLILNRSPVILRQRNLHSMNFDDLKSPI
jgi:hypothetical protein